MRLSTKIVKIIEAGNYTRFTENYDDWDTPMRTYHYQLGISHNGRVVSGGVAVRYAIVNNAEVFDAVWLTPLHYTDTLDDMDVMERFALESEVAMKLRMI